MGNEQPEPTAAPETASLQDRLTSGEAPSLVPRPPFALPGLDDAEPTVLKTGTQVLLLAATQTERDAVLDRLMPLEGQQRVLRVFSGAQTYYVGRLGSVDVVLTTCRAGSQQRDGSGLVTYEAIGRVYPRAVVAVGMAFGGYTQKLRIGDVLVSTHVVPYEPSRIQASGDIHRGGEPEAGALLLNRFLEARGWTFPRTDGYACQVREGRILSGEKLVDSLEFKRELFAAHPEAIGGEMEGSGVAGAAARRNISEWIIVKAVCDWGDGTKHKEHQPLAAAAAVALVEHVFTPKGVLDDLPSPTTTDTEDEQTETVPSNVVKNVGTQVGTQNIVFGNQTLISASSPDIDELLDAIKLFLDRGLEAEADPRLAYANTRVWSRMDNAQKARLRGLTATRKSLAGDNAGAARDLLEAHDLNPGDEKAVSRKCQAFLLQNRTSEAYELAKAALAAFPNHPYARPYLIRSAPADVPIDSLLPENWRTLRLKPEEAVAAAQRVWNSDLAAAAELLSAANEPRKDDSDYWPAVASVKARTILEDERRDNEVSDSRREDLISTLKLAYVRDTRHGDHRKRAMAIAENARWRSPKTRHHDHRKRASRSAVGPIPRELTEV